jgi:uncharacterized protein (TIGR02118 family)
MAKARILSIVATECSPEDDAKFNKWYNEVHIPMLFKNKDLKKVARYKVTIEKGEKPRYLAVYEFDTKEALSALTASPEFKAAIEEMQETQQNCKFEIKSATTCEPIKTWEK